MMATLFDPPAQHHSETSVAAARSMRRTAPTLRTVVYDFIASRGDYGATDMEIEDNTAMISGTARARRVELHQAGKIRDSGKRRLSPRGRYAVVWMVAEDKPALTGEPCENCCGNGYTMMEIAFGTERETCERCKGSGRQS